MRGPGKTEREGDRSKDEGDSRMCIPRKKRRSKQQSWHEQLKGRRSPCAISWGIWKRLWPEQDRLAEVGNCYLGEEGWGH